MVVLDEVEYTRTVFSSVATGEGGFSIGSGLLRTSSAAAGTSGFSSGTGGALRKRGLRRYHQKRPTVRPKKISTPITAPAKAPLLTPPDEPEGDDGFGSHLIS